MSVVGRSLNKKSGRTLFPQLSCIGRPTCSSATHERVVVTEPGVVESLLNAQQFEVSERWGRPAKIKMRLALLVSRNGISGRRKYSTAICSDLRSAWASMSQGRRPTVDECGGA